MPSASQLKGKTEGVLQATSAKAAPEAKLSTAWLGFYVGLTKASPASASTATTEAAMSEADFSSKSSSPRQEQAPHSKVAKWSDMDDDELEPEDGDEEEADGTQASPSKRSRRSNRRRRARGKAKRAAAAAAAAAATLEEQEEEEFEDDQADDLSSIPLASAATMPCCPPPSTPPRLGALMSTSPMAAQPRLPDGAMEASARVPFQAPSLMAAAPPSSPSKARSSALGIVSTSPMASAQSSMAQEASMRTPPLQPSMAQEASMRTPPPISLAAATSQPPMVPMLPVCGTPTWGQNIFVMTSPCQSCPADFFSPGPAAPPCTPQQFCQTMSPASFMSPTFHDPATPEVVRSWLSVPATTSNEELAARLIAAAPETYED